MRSTSTGVVTTASVVDGRFVRCVTPTRGSATFTCDDDGVFTAVATPTTVTAATATASVTLNVANADPAVSITIAPTLPRTAGAVVDVAASIIDPGANDTRLCAIDWGDGNVRRPVSPATPTCGASHAYATKGTKHVVVSVMDDDGGTATASTTVTVLDRTPSATAAAVSHRPRTRRVPITLTGTDPDGDALTFLVTGTPAHGSLTGTGANRTYTPAPDYHGADSFTFTVSDGSSTSAPATVTITVTPVNDPPVANPVSDRQRARRARRRRSRSPAPTSTAIALTVVIVTPPAHGTLTGSGSAFTYTSTAGYAGPGLVRLRRLRRPRPVAAGHSSPIDVTTPPGAPRLLLADDANRLSNVRSLGGADLAGGVERVRLPRPASGDLDPASVVRAWTACRSAPTRPRRTTSTARRACGARAVTAPRPANPFESNLLSVG